MKDSEGTQCYDAIRRCDGIADCRPSASDEIGCSISYRRRTFVLVAGFVVPFQVHTNATTFVRTRFDVGMRRTDVMESISVQIFPMRKDAVLLQKLSTVWSRSIRIVFRIMLV